MLKLKIVTLSLLIGVALAGGATYAAVSWQDTNWIQNNQKIDGTKIKKSFDYLKEQVATINNQISNFATESYVDNRVNTTITQSSPPVCSGTNKALQWTGSAWGCATIKSTSTTTVNQGK